MEQRLIADYERDITELLVTLDASRLDAAIAIASLPEQIRGFGHVKARNAEAIYSRRKQLLALWRRQPQPAEKAA